MDVKQPEYMIAIAEEGSIAAAAARMFVTQSALNQQLLKLEAELGTPLFERQYHKMVPTYAGENYIAAARQMVAIKNDTYKMIRDIAQEKAGEISLAYSPEQGSLLFSKIYPVFHEKYPDFHFKNVEGRIPKIEQLLLSREVTYGLLAYSKQSPKKKDFTYLPNGREYIVLAVPTSHPLAYLAGEESWDSLPPIDITLFKDDAFILPSKDTGVSKMLHSFFDEVNFQPKILLESASSYTIQRCVNQQMGPGFLPQSYATCEMAAVFFRTKPALYWNRSIAYLKGTYVSEPEKYMIQLLQDYA